MDFTEEQDLETLALKRKITDMLNMADDESTEFTMN